MQRDRLGGAELGLHDIVADPTHRPPIGTAGMLLGGTALYLAVFGFTRWAMFHLVSVIRLTAAAVILALVPLSIVVPGLVVLALAGLVVAGLNVIEWRMNRRIGWRTLTATRATTARETPGPGRADG